MPADYLSFVRKITKLKDIQAQSGGLKQKYSGGYLTET
jgi:hypothetical protein